MMRTEEALQLLGVAASATPAEIKAAYRRLVKTWHPDRHSNDERRRVAAEEALKQIIEGYQCLRHGVPPLESKSDRLQTGAGAASMFSVRPTAPLAGRPGRQSPSIQTARASRRGRYRAAVWIPIVIAIGAFVVSSGTWSLTRRPALEQKGEATSWAVPVKATRVGLDRVVQNPTNVGRWGCRAWVGPKFAMIGRFGPDATLTLPANAFDPGLSELDDDKALELFCAPNR